MARPNIQKPKDVKFKSGKISAELKFNVNFKQKWQGKYQKAQEFVDSEVLRLSDPYTPLRTGMLIKSGTLGTTIGSGLVQWIAPYARRQYYRPGKVGSQTGPLRGPYWFRRMWATYKAQVVKKTEEIIKKD